MPNPPCDDSPPPSDQDLVAAANAGHPGAFEALYHRHRDWVISLAMRFTADPDLALDVAQETFIYLLSKFPGFTLTARLTTFLYPAVKNLSIGLKKKSRRMKPAADETLDSLPAPAPGQTPLEAGDLPQVLSALPETHREVILMRFVDAMSLEEIAQSLEIPVGTVKSRLHNAIAMMRDDPRVRRFFDQAGEAENEKRKT